MHPSLNERKHYPTEQQSFYQAPAVTQHNQRPPCSSPGAPWHLTRAGENPNEGKSAPAAGSPGATLPTRSLAAAPAPAALLPSHRASLCLPGCPAPSRPIGTTKGATKPRAVPQAELPRWARRQPPPTPHGNLTFQAEHPAARRAAARRGPASLPPSRPAGKRGRRSAATDGTGRSSWGGTVWIICQRLSLPSCSSWASRGQRQGRKSL